MTGLAIQPRTWVIYRFWDAQGRLLYVGQTARDAIVRWMEHLADKWWAPLIAKAEVDPVTYSSLADVLRVEKSLIRSSPRPYCNIEHNLDNPDRWIGPARGRAQRSAGPIRSQSLRPISRRRIRWTRARIRAAVVAGAWLATTTGIWLAIGGRVPAVRGLELGAVVSTVVLIAAWRQMPRRRRR